VGREWGSRGWGSKWGGLVGFWGLEGRTAARGTTYSMANAGTPNHKGQSK
jgi:hypothetical protein